MIFMFKKIILIFINIVIYTFLYWLILTPNYQSLDFQNSDNNILFLSMLNYIL